MASASLGSNSKINVMLGLDTIKLDVIEATIKGSRKTDTKYILGRDTPMYVQSNPEFSGSVTVLTNDNSEKLADSFNTSGDVPSIVIELENRDSGKVYQYINVVVENIDYSKLSSQETRTTVISFKAGKCIIS